MAAFLVFFGSLLLSQFVALLAALQLADYFQISDQFVPVMVAIIVFASVAIAVFAMAYSIGRSNNAIGWAAISLAVVASVMVMVPSTVQRFAVQATSSSSSGLENTFIAIELLIPALIAILIQWGLVRRHHKRVHGEDDLTLWPWVTLVVVGFAVLNPLGLRIVGAALGSSPTDWIQTFWRTLIEAIGAVIVVMIAIECYIRGRMLHRRQAADS